MIYTADTKKALKLCFEAHKDQVDKTGMPYVLPVSYTHLTLPTILRV